MTDNEISAYAIAKICGYNDSFENFKLLYNQYCDEISKLMQYGFLIFISII